MPVNLKVQRSAQIELINLGGSHTERDSAPVEHLLWITKTVFSYRLALKSPKSLWIADKDTKCKYAYINIYFLCI